jgi:hypothetical protein
VSKPTTKQQKQLKVPQSKSRKAVMHEVKVSRKTRIVRGNTAVECYIDGEPGNGLYDIFPDVITVTNAALIVQYNIIQLPGVFLLSIFNADPLGRVLDLDADMVIAKAVKRS